ncbi:hypothetical protein BDZ91DRAFT_845551 [Kalaharituber pfeilii]|nr:hypothetical protein BDZ91DRAFT_845551 [Kalaharituber pfeilii]
MKLAASAAGLAGLAGLTLQLAQVARDCANIYTEVKEVGYTHDSVLHNLRTEGLRLKRWEQAWGLDAGNTSGNTSGKELQLLDPSDERYRYAAAGLARIVYVFTKVAKTTNGYLCSTTLGDLESFDINNYIPSCDFRTVIITSRRRRSTQGRRGLGVHQMQNNEAERLLLTSASLDLESLTPEAHAGAYINIQQCQFGHYLREYKMNVNLLLSRKWIAGKDDRSFFATWELSFDAIKNQNPKAAELLSLCAFLDNNDISEEFLRRGMKLATNDTSLADSIHLLFSYSIAKQTKRYDSFNIHPLVHLCVLWKLEMEPDKYQ